MTSRMMLQAGAVLGGSGVAFGAFGAHGLNGLLTERGMLHAWETAAHYQQLHGVALIALAALSRTGAGGRAARIAAWCWTGGSILFSGSLYVLATGSHPWAGPITPLGGVALLTGWIALIGTAIPNGTND